jgi:hypothetical protein
MADSTRETIDKNPGAGIAVLVLIALCGVCGLWGQCSGSGSGPAKDTAACGHWRNVRSDLAANVLTMSEAREKLGQVRDGAVTPTVRGAATRMLAGLTMNSGKVAVTGMGELDAACTGT